MWWLPVPIPPKHHHPLSLLAKMLHFDHKLKAVLLNQFLIHFQKGSSMTTSVSPYFWGSLMTKMMTKPWTTIQMHWSKNSFPQLTTRFLNRKQSSQYVYLYSPILLYMLIIYF
jgi:hypothetical protein